MTFYDFWPILMVLKGFGKLARNLRWQDPRWPSSIYFNNISTIFRQGCPFQQSWFEWGSV